MKIHDVIHGFAIRAVHELSEIRGKLWEMEHVKSGAKLVWLDRKDENKTFSITFRTLPSDDTGVFHILEHSLLCGSQHYPVKEPFVELMKSSMHTFLNAMTFPDILMRTAKSQRSGKDSVGRSALTSRSCFARRFWIAESISTIKNSGTLSLQLITRLHSSNV